MTWNRTARIAGLSLFGTLGVGWIQGCGSETVSSAGTGGAGGGSEEACSGALANKLDVLEQVADVGTARVAALKAATATACANIATGLGQTVADVSDPASLSLDELEEICNVAASAIDAEAQANGSVVLAYSDGYCAIDVDGQSACESELATGSCEPEPLEARCPAQALAGECAGQCAGACNAPSGAECSGSCQGLCTGSCQGTCTPTSSSGCICEGSCGGLCEGQCEGSAPGSNCTGICLGACDASLASSFCTDELTPASCDIEEGCRGACVAQGWFGATCEPGSAYAAGNATLEPLLDEHLPALYDASSVSGPALTEGYLRFTDALDPALWSESSACSARHLALVEQTSDDVATLTAIIGATAAVVGAVN